MFLADVERCHFFPPSAVVVLGLFIYFILFSTHKNEIEAQVKVCAENDSKELKQVCTVNDDTKEPQWEISA